MNSNRLILSIITVVFSLPGFAAVNVDLRGEFESWNAGLGGTSSGLLGGFGLSYQYNDKIFSGGSLSIGKYSIASHADNGLARRDGDLYVGYRVLPNVAAFAGYRLNSIRFDNAIDGDRSFSDISHGIGIGVSAFHVFAPRWVAYGRMSISGLLSTVSYDTGVDDRGTGINISEEAGAIYHIRPRTSAGVNLKLNNASVNYGGDAGRWAHSYVRFGLNVSQSF